MPPRHVSREKPKQSGVTKKRRDHSIQPRKEVEIPQLFQMVVECGDEERQRRLYEQLTSEGWKCRLMNL